MSTAHSVETSLLAKVCTTVTTHQLFAKDAVLIVGVSGGADSVALLDLLSSLPGYTLQLVVAHLNHCLRGEESDGDEALCRTLAERYGVPCEVKRVAVREVAAAARMNLEDAARQERMAFFDHLRVNYAAAAVVLGHHGDDQAETVLMRLLRGSGAAGLSGMAFRNRRGYARPLLGIRRHDLEQYLLARGLSWRDDSSNNDPGYLRNRIRHQLLPLLEQYNPALRGALCATAELLSDDNRELEQQAAEAVARLSRVERAGLQCDAGQLKQLGVAVQRRVIRQLYAAAAGSCNDLDHQHVNAVRALLDGHAPNAGIALPHGISALRAYDTLWVGKTPADTPAGFCFDIAGYGCYELPGGGRLTVSPAAEVCVPASATTVWLDAGTLPFPWQVRTMEPGDRMVPFGMSGRKKVKNIFIDRKIPRWQRAQTPILLCGGEIIWLAGVCAAEASRRTGAAQQLVKVEYTGG